MDERRDDWRHGVDESLVSLNASQRVWEREFVALLKRLAEIDSQLRGNPLSEQSGLVGRLEQIERTVAKIDAVLFMDPSGTKGLVHDFNELKVGREDRRGLWKNLTAIIIAGISSGLIGHFWENIQAYFSKPTRDPVEQMIENAKHPKPRHRHGPIRQNLPDPEEEN